MMSRKSLAQQSYEAGLLALGIPVNGQQNEIVNREQALLFFQDAVVYDAMHCDAWLGFILCGHADIETLYRIYESRDNLRRGQAEANTNYPVWINGTYTLGVLHLNICTIDAITLCYAITSIIPIFDEEGNIVQAPDYKEAEYLAEQIVDEQMRVYMFMLIYIHTDRWNDALQILSTIDVKPVKHQEFMNDVELCDALDFMRAMSCAHLGMFNEAYRILVALQAESQWAGGREKIEFYYALVLRSLGEEAEAHKVLEKLYSRNPDPNGEIYAAFHSRNVKLDVVSIEENTESFQEKNQETQKNVEEILALIDSKVGMEKVKGKIQKISDAVEFQKMKRENGLEMDQARSHHVILDGPPGTGKTTVARILGQIYHALGILKTDNVVEVKRKDLVGEHLGSTAPKTTAKLEEARGGVLFIDEAYTLNQKGLSGGDAFGKEAVDTIMQYMEDHRDEIVVIIAGYEEEINDFLEVNPGLRSRFSHRIEFESYSSEQLVSIAKVLAKNLGHELDDQACIVLEGFLAPLTIVDPTGKKKIDELGNARFIRNILEEAESVLAGRIIKMKRESIPITADMQKYFTSDDIREGFIESVQQTQKKQKSLAN